jgi:hypothetical protein
VTFQDFAINMLSSATFSSLVTGILAFLGRDWISQRLKNSIKHEYDSKLATHKANLDAANQVAIAQLKFDIEKEASINLAARLSFAEGQKAAMDRRIEAVNKIWIDILKTKGLMFMQLQLLDVLTEQELDNEKLPEILKAPDLTDTFKKEMDNIKLEGIELQRPYVGEYIFSQAYLYQSVIIRIATLIVLSQINPQKIKWFKDAGTRNLLTAALSETEMKEFDALKFGKINWFKNKMEEKILQSFQKLITGEIFGDEAIKHANKILSEIAKNKKNPDTIDPRK